MEEPKGIFYLWALLIKECTISRVEDNRSTAFNLLMKSIMGVLMKKIILLFILFRGAFALEPFLDLEGEYRLQNFDRSRWQYETIGGVTHDGEDWYAETSLIGEEGSGPEVSLYTGYLEYYAGDLTLSGGRQMISWGHSYIFNLSDVFNEIDIEDPRGDKRGVDSLRVRYSAGDASRVEVVGFKADEKDDNFAGRYTFLWEDYEFMLNYFNITEVSPVTEKVEETERYVLEAKGDMVIGVWCQLSYDKFQRDRVHTLVLGGDYNFDLYGKTLYTAAEGIFSKELSGLYMTYNLRINEAVEFYQGYLLTQGRRYINSTLNYIYNDYVNFDLAHNYYHNFQELGGVFQEVEGLRHEVVLRIRMNFFLQRKPFQAFRLLKTTMLPFLPTEEAMPPLLLTF